MGMLRRRSRRLCAVFSLLTLAVFFSMPARFALASTVGVISGTVTDSASHAGIANVRVTASSASGSYRATTNARGFYSMTGVYSDTYTVSFQYDGYEPVSVPGVSVYADQVATLNETLTKSLRTIAAVRTHAVSSAYQPNQTTDTVTVAAPQIQNFQGSNFNTNESNLITSLPGAELDSSGYPVIHGGREYEEGFEFEGIPYTDAFTNQFNNTLSIPTAGVGLVQLTPGAGEVNQGTGGGFGTLNVVAKRGTYPPYADLAGGVGAPTFSHSVNFDYSWATPDGRWSNYLSMANGNLVPQYGNDGHPLAFIGEYYNTGLESDRETLDNLVYRFGPNSNQSVQAFVDIAQHDFFENAGGLSSLCFYSCDPQFTGTWSGIFGMSPAQVTRISSLYPGQPSLTSTLAQASNRAPFTFWQPNQAFKLEYTNAINSSTYFNIMAYRTNSVVTFDGPGSQGSATSGSYSLQGGQTSGVTAAFQKQLSDKHLFQAGADVSHLHPVFAFQSQPDAMFASLLGALTTTPDAPSGLFDQFVLPFAFISPTDPDGCPLQTAFGVPAGPGTTCGYAYTAFPSATQLNFPSFFEVATVQRQDYSLYASDKWQPNDRLNVQFGARMDAATYRMPTPGIDPFYCTTQYLPTSWTPPTTFNAADGFVCNAKATFSFLNDAVRPKIFEPRLGLSYKFGDNTAVRLTYSKAVQFVPVADFDFAETPQNNYIVPYGKLAPWDPLGVGTHCGMTTAVSGSSLVVPCRNFGEQLYWINQNADGVAYQPARPTTSDNYQLTVSHEFTSGFLNGVAISISPWFRKQHDTIAAESSPLLTSTGQPEVINGVIQFGPSLLTNNGKEQATGVDLNITRQIAYGLSGQFTASYINEFSSVIPLSGSEDFYPSIVPASVALGNVYRVGFLSPFQTTLGLTWRTRNGWRFNPRYTYNIGYPTGVGTITAADVNGVPFNLPNTNVLPGSAPSGPGFYVDPMNPGSFFAPNIAASRGESEAASPGGKLTPPQGFFNFSVEYAPPQSRFSIGADIFNIFNQVYSGAVLSSRYQPLATGISGPLSGFSTNSINYTNYPSAWPQYLGFMHGKEVWVNVPSAPGRSVFFYVQVRV
jgi:hypothetical protein